MSMHNRKLSHQLEAPCRICRTPTQALVKGVVQHHPVCEACRADMARQFSAAQAQRRRQSIRKEAR